MIVTFSRKSVDQWRESHRHEVPEEAAEHVAVGAGQADAQIAYPEHDWHRPTIGFSPNGQ